MRAWLLGQQPFANMQVLQASNIQYQAVLASLRSQQMAIASSLPQQAYLQQLPSAGFQPLQLNPMQSLQMPVGSAGLPYYGQPMPGAVWDERAQSALMGQPAMYGANAAARYALFETYGEILIVPPSILLCLSRAIGLLCLKAITNPDDNIL